MIETRCIGDRRNPLSPNNALTANMVCPGVSFDIVLPRYDESGKLQRFSPDVRGVFMEGWDGEVSRTVTVLAWLALQKTDDPCPSLQVVPVNLFRAGILQAGDWYRKAFTVPAGEESY